MTKKVSAKYLKVIGPVFITKPDFAAYLSKHLTKKYVRGNPGNCPLAAASGYAIGASHYVAVTNDKTIPLPKWAKTFVTRVDKEEGTITGKEALAILKKVK